MSTGFTVPSGRHLKAVQFVVVNNRIPCSDQRCALCGSLIEKGYVRDLETRLPYCDTQCFEVRAHEAVRIRRNRGRKAS
jgi:hypothetical protein